MYYQPLEINDWYLLSVIPSHIVQKDSADILLTTYIFTATCVIIFIILIPVSYTHLDVYKRQNTGFTTFPAFISLRMAALHFSSFTYLKATRFGTTVQRCSSFRCV